LSYLASTPRPLNRRHRDIQAKICYIYSRRSIQQCGRAMTASDGVSRSSTIDQPEEYRVSCRTNVVVSPVVAIVVLESEQQGTAEESNNAVELIVGTTLRKK
jgi:hypothetical protein